MWLLGLSGKESAGNAGDQGLIAGLVRSPGDGNINPLQYSCLENSMGRGAWQAVQSMDLQKRQTQLSHEITTMWPLENFKSQKWLAWTSAELKIMALFLPFSLHISGYHFGPRLSCLVRTTACRLPPCHFLLTPSFLLAGKIFLNQCVILVLKADSLLSAWTSLASLWVFWGNCTSF